MGSKPFACQLDLFFPGQLGGREGLADLVAEGRPGRPGGWGRRGVGEWVADNRLRAMSEAWAEGLSRRRSAHDAFSRTASAFAGITQEELDELKELYFLDEQQVQTYVTSFHRYDEDKSGDIDCKELGLLLRDLGINLPPADVFDMIQAVDLDGSGSIGL